MITLAIWWTAMFLELLILVRGWQSRILKKYAFFYAYMAIVFVNDFSLYILYLIRPGAYGIWAWRAELLDFIFVFGLLLEPIRHVLSPNPLSQRFAIRSRGVVLGGTLCFAALCSFRASKFQQVDINLERGIAAVQGILLLILIAAIFYYGVPLGRNIKGMILGYGFCLGTTILILTLRSYIGPAFDNVWDISQPLSFVVGLCIWLVTLWGYHPNPVLRNEIQFEIVREGLVRRMRYRMGEMRAYFARMARP